MNENEVNKNFNFPVLSDGAFFNHLYELGDWIFFEIAQFLGISDVLNFGSTCRSAYNALHAPRLQLSFWRHLLCDDLIERTLSTDLIYSDYSREVLWRAWRHNNWRVGKCSLKWLSASHSDDYSDVCRISTVLSADITPIKSARGKKVLDSKGILHGKDISAFLLHRNSFSIPSVNGVSNSSILLCDSSFFSNRVVDLESLSLQSPVCIMTSSVIPNDSARSNLLSPSKHNGLKHQSQSLLKVSSPFPILPSPIFYEGTPPQLSHIANSPKQLMQTPVRLSERAGKRRSIPAPFVTPTREPTKYDNSLKCLIRYSWVSGNSSVRVTNPVYLLEQSFHCELVRHENELGDERVLKKKKLQKRLCVENLDNHTLVIADLKSDEGKSDKTVFIQDQYKPSVDILTSESNKENVSIEVNKLITVIDRQPKMQSSLNEYWTRIDPDLVQNSMIYEDTKNRQTGTLRLRTDLYKNKGRYFDSTEWMPFLPGIVGIPSTGLDSIVIVPLYSHPPRWLPVIPDTEGRSRTFRFSSTSSIYSNNQVVIAGIDRRRDFFGVISCSPLAIVSENCPTASYPSVQFQCDNIGDQLTAISVSSDNNIVTGGRGGSVCVWELTNYGSISLINKRHDVHEKDVSCIAIQRAEYCISSRESLNERILPCLQNQQGRRFNSHTQSYDPLCMDELYNDLNMDYSRDMEWCHNGVFNHSEYSSLFGHSILATGSSDCTILISDIRCCRYNAKLLSSSPVTSLVFGGHQSQNLISGSSDGKISIWDLRNTVVPVVSLSGLDGCVSSLQSDRRFCFFEISVRDSRKFGLIDFAGP